MEQNPPGEGGRDRKALGIGSGIAIGVGAGTALGVALDNIGLGIAIGVAIGVAIGAALNSDTEAAGEEPSSGKHGFMILMITLGLFAFSLIAFAIFSAS